MKVFRVGFRAVADANLNAEHVGEARLAGDRQRAAGDGCSDAGAADRRKRGRLSVVQQGGIGIVRRTQRIDERALGDAAAPAVERAVRQKEVQRVAVAQQVFFAGPAGVGVVAPVRVGVQAELLVERVCLLRPAGRSSSPEPNSVRLSPSASEACKGIVSVVCEYGSVWLPMAASTGAASWPLGAQRVRSNVMLP